MLKLRVISYYFVQVLCVKMLLVFIAFLPFGLKVLHKVERIVREEMERAGAVELLMPAMQAAELWQESGRWYSYGSELMRMKDRNAREFALGATHEEVITDLVRDEVKSYKKLPLTLYQIQTKFP